MRNSVILIIGVIWKTLDKMYGELKMIKISLIVASVLCLTTSSGLLAQPATDAVPVGEEIAPESVTPACPEPRPERIGCRYIGKPCIEFVCMDGQWEPMSIETSFPNRPGSTVPDIPCEFLEGGCDPYLPRR